MITLPAPIRQASPQPVAKAGPVGPGAGVLMTEYLLTTAMAGDPAKRMANAMAIGLSVKWIRKAEQTIGGKIAGAEWHLEDPDGNTIDDDWKGSRLALLARDLMADPMGEVPIEEVGRRLTRRNFLTITSRHMGLAGQGAWLLDMRDDLGLPHNLLYIRPDRLTPDTTKTGVLIQWLLDKRPGTEGIPIKVDDLRLVHLEPPDSGMFAPGLVESALVEASSSGLAERHWGAVLASGGRLSGILSPKDAPITDDTVFEQLQRDWRNITEQPEAARRLQIVRAPVDFTSTVQDAGTLRIIEFMEANRDGLLALWGVPLTLLNGQNAGSTGLNGGETRNYDEAALWQGAVHARIVEIEEAAQSILDLWEPHLGWAPKLCIEEPSFDDETPAYDRAQKAVGQPLRNVERRAILGLEPFGDPVLDNAVWMPAMTTDFAMAPDENGSIPKATPGVSQEPEPIPQPLVPYAGKARTIDPGARRLRETMQRSVTPRFRGAVGAALADQRDAVTAAVERNWGAIAQHGARDESQWWRDSELERVIRPAVTGIAERVADHITGTLGG